MNGLEVQDLLVKSGNTAPLIFITAHDEVGVRDKALAAGQWAFCGWWRGDNVEIIARSE